MVGAVPAPPHSVRVPCEQLRAALEGALAILADEPLVTLSTRPGGVTVSAVAGSARFEAKVAAPGFSGPAVGVPLDGRRLLGLLGAFGAEHTLTVRYESPARPIVIEAGSDCRCVQVPMRGRESAPGR